MESRQHSLDKSQSRDLKTVVTRSALIPTLLLFAGCTYQPVVADGHTPIPQSLIQAAERASESRLIVADIMARSHGQSVAQTRLDLPDSHIPGFLMQRVRLDYNGPMQQVLDRLSADIGYRVVEYNKEASGATWQPWIRLDGDKPLIQHIREMNSQMPWHLVLDHRNHRMVVDYDADGSMASQVRDAQAAMDKQLKSERKTPNLPNTSSMESAADRQVSREVIPEPVNEYTQAQPVPSQTSAPSRQPELSPAMSQTATTAAPVYAAAPAPLATPMPVPVQKNSLPVMGRGYWYAGIEGYQTKERAEMMKDWLLGHDYLAMVYSRPHDHEVQIPARDDGEAAQFATDLKALSVPARVAYMSAAGATTTPDTGPKPYQTRTPMVAASPAAASEVRNTRADSPSAKPAVTKKQATAAPLEDLSAIPTSEMEGGKWYVQVAYLRKATSIERTLGELRDKKYQANAYRLGSGRALRIGPYADRETAIKDLSVLRSAGFPDAYPILGGKA